jgi:uncharacterized iron-regulated membrane protein
VKARSVRIWSIVHRWTSLVSTVFLLLLCLTGLPLVFHHEIDELLGYAPKPQTVFAGAQRSTVDRIAEAALAADPGKVLQYIAWDRDKPGIVVAYTNSAADGKPDDAVVKAFDAYSAKPLGPVGTGPMLVVVKLHTDLFMGQPGKLFLGGMGLLFLVAIISGVVLYWPVARRLEFGTLRQGKSNRILWLDWHNLLGVIAVVWAFVVGGTGVINTWAEPMLEQWRTNELASMAASSAGSGAAPSRTVSLDRIVGNATRAAPGMEVAFIAFPGTPFSSSHHFATFMRGDRPLTSRLLKPILLDAATAEVADSRDLPFYLKALFISQPLHFGDYGGMPLKIIWALIDGFTIVVIGSGLYLYLVRRRKAGHRRTYSGIDTYTART